MGGVVKAITNIVKTVVKAVVGVVKAVIDFVGDVIGFVLNPFGIFDTPQVDDPGQQAQGVTLTKSGTTVPIPLVYGFRRVGGSIIFVETNGSSNRYLYVVYAICEGEIHGVTKVFIDDNELPLPSGTVYTNGSINSPTSGKYNGRLQFQLFYGSDSQGQSSLANEAATWGNKKRTMPGIAYAVMRYEWKEIKSQEDADNNPYSGGIPTVKFDVLGKKVYDVSTHAGGVDLVGTYANRSKSYSINPASCLLDYLENPRYGAGISATELHADSFKIAADKFDQIVNYSNSQSGQALTMNAVINTGGKVLDNVKTLAAGARGIMPFVQGRYKLKVEDSGHPTDITSTAVQIAYDVDKTEIIGGLSMEGERKSTKYNQVIVNYIDPDQNFSNQQVVYNISGDQTIDNDEELTGNFTFHTCTNKAIARDLAELIYKKSRAQRQISFTATQELLDVEVGDVIRITDTVLDLSLDTFRVVGIKLRNDGNVDVDCVEHDATVYPFTTGAQVEIPPALYLPDEFYLAPLVRSLPNEPYGIYPPFNPGNPGQPNNPNINQPLPSLTVNQFTDYTKVGPKGNLMFVSFAPPVGTFPNVDNGYIHTDSTMGLVYWHGNAAIQAQNTYAYYGSARLILAPNDFFELNFTPPTDATVDEILIRRYNNSVLQDEKRIDIYAYGRDTMYDPALNRRTRFDRYSGHLIPNTFNFFPVNADDVYKVVYRKSSTLTEFPDGSIASPELVSAGGYTYRDLDGGLTTGYNISAFLNYLKDTYFGNQITQNKSTNHSLGT